MIKKHFIYLSVLLLSISLILVGLHILQKNSNFKPVLLKAQIHLPFDFDILLQEINKQNLTALEEIYIFSDKQGGEVLQITLSSDACCILAVNQNGFLSAWNIANKKKVSQYRIGYVYPSVLEFGANGDKLLTPYRIVDNNKIAGVIVWDTRTGKIAYCNGKKDECPEESLQAETIEDGYYLDPTGEWLYGYSITTPDNPAWGYSFNISNYHIYGLDNYYDSANVISGSEYLDTDEYFNDPNAEAVAITTDIQAEYIAYAFANGVVRFRQWYDLPMFTGANSAYILNYEQAYQAERIHVIDMKIDNTRNWLAVLNNKELLVWNLQRGKIFPLVIHEQLSDAIALYFDQRGNSLAVAVKDRILLYDLNSRDQIQIIDADGVSSLYISPDNRLLVWGDAEGNIHLWGVPEK